MTEPQSGGARASPVGRIPGAAGEFLTFRLGGEEYGIEILKVQEIRGYEAVTAIARAPDFIKGVINLRGVIVPIIDLRIKFQSGEADYNQFTVVILLNLGSRLVGIVVDSVSDAITLRPEQIKPAPQLASSLDTGHVTGIGSANQRKLIFVDIERLMMSSDMVLMDEVLAA